MEGVEDEIPTLLLEDPSSPMKDQRKRKRLKKASEVSDPSMRGSPLCPPPEFSGPEHDASEGGALPDPAELSDPSPPRVGSERPDEETAFDDGLNPLFGVQYPLEETGVESLDNEREMKLSEGIETSGKETEDRVKKESAKRRLNMEEGLEEPKRKKEVSEEREKKDGKSGESAREKRKLEKERKVYLEQLHAESQKLLRETRDASFKPMMPADNPISSVLEKIRQRKHGLLKRNVAADDAAQPVLVQFPPSDSASARNLPLQDEEEEKSAEETNQSVERVNEIHDTNDVHQCQNPDSSDESSSSEEEEEYDKENIDPRQERPAAVDLYRKNDLVKGFVDEEAEEEDDSDHDLMRFHDDEDDEDDGDDDEAEILADLIAPSYKEKQSDTEKRNELHQKWLQYQDAADTDSLLQRLNSNAEKQKTPFMIQNDDDKDDDDADDDGDDDDDDDDDNNEDSSKMNSTRQNVRQAKERIAQMYTDSEVAYVSDDEENRQSVLRSCLSLDHSLDRSSVLAPPEDENSREVFGLIRKVNSLPETKRKANTIAANFDTLAIGGNGGPFKPSFMGRTSGNAVTSYLRQVSSGSRSFVFSRDDSNSRGPDLSLDNVPDAPGPQPPKTRPPERSTLLRRKSDDSSSGASLFEILRRTSCSRVDPGPLTSSNSGAVRISSSQTVRRFSAFRLTKKAS